MLSCISWPVEKTKARGSYQMPGLNQALRLCHSFRRPRSGHSRKRCLRVPGSQRCRQENKHETAHGPGNPFSRQGLGCRGRPRLAIPQEQDQSVFPSRDNRLGTAPSVGSRRERLASVNGDRGNDPFQHAPLPAHPQAPRLIRVYIKRVQFSSARLVEPFEKLCFLVDPSRLRVKMGVDKGLEPEKLLLHLL